MAIPAFLASSFRILRINGLTDVSQLITALTTELVAAGWTNNGGGSFTSPVDGVGRFHTNVFARSAAGLMTMETFDQNSSSLGKYGINFSTTAGQLNTVNVYSGQFHLHIEVYNPGSVLGYICSGILDESPEAQNAHTRYVYNGSYYDSNGNALTTPTWPKLGMKDNTTNNFTFRCVEHATTNSSGAAKFTLGGNLCFYPREVFCSTATLTYPICGRCYQQIIVPDVNNSPGSIIQVPIDGATLGTFQVTNVGGFYFLLAIRIG